jgi:citrate lyase subunit beta/citryl-CoA lyase
MRSFLDVAAPDFADLAATFGSGADVLILDLTRAASLAGAAEARAAMAEALRRHAGTAGRPRLWVRINGFASGLADLDLDAAVAAGADGIVLPKAAGGADVTRLDAKIAVAEAIHAIPDGRTRVVATIGETALSVFQAGTYRGASHRLAGLLWNAGGLAADLGVSAIRDTDGALRDTFRHARSAVLLGAAAADVPAIDDATEAGHDLADDCRRAAADGFAAKLTGSAGDVAAINAAFTPSQAEIDEAQAIVAAFAAAAGAPVVEWGGRLLDRSRLTRALGRIARAGR